MKGALKIWIFWFSFQLLASFFLFNYSPIDFRLGFTFVEVGMSGSLPGWIASRANFDGFHYVKIATENYGEYQQTFFPLLPILIRILSFISIDNLTTLGLIMNASLSLATVVIWYNILERTFSGSLAKKSIITMLAFPSAFFLFTLYTESLFIFLLGIYTYSVINQKKPLAIISGILLGLTRLVGIFAIAIPFSYFAFSYFRDKKRVWGYITSALGPILGLILYISYLFVRYKSPLLFITAQKGFGNERATEHIVIIPQVIWRYIKIIFSAGFDFGYFVAIVELIMFLFVGYFLMRKSLALWRSISSDLIKKEYSPLEVGLLIFSVANLILPTLTGTLSSVPRYALPGISLYITMAQILPKKILLALLMALLMLQIILLAFFQKGYFVS